MSRCLHITTTSVTRNANVVCPRDARAIELRGETHFSVLGSKARAGELTGGAPVKCFVIYTHIIYVYGLTPPDRGSWIWPSCKCITATSSSAAPHQLCFSYGGGGAAAAAVPRAALGVRQEIPDGANAPDPPPRLSETPHSLQVQKPSEQLRPTADSSFVANM